jgi:hypothetical protein
MVGGSSPPRSSSPISRAIPTTPTSPWRWRSCAISPPIWPSSASIRPEVPRAGFAAPRYGRSARRGSPARRIEAMPRAASASAPGISGTVASSDPPHAAGAQHLVEMPGEAEAGDIGHGTGLGGQDRAASPWAASEAARARRCRAPRPFCHLGGQKRAAAQRAWSGSALARPRAALGQHAFPRPGR